MKRGVFIAFEGIDGCGKSTQIRKLVQHISEKSKHNHVILTRNPYKDVNIRKIIASSNNPVADAEKLAELFINDRKICASEIITPNIAHGHFVLCDRYKLSTISYQSSQGLNMTDLIERQKELPIPDMTFFIDVSPEEASARMRKEDESIRGKEHKFEAHLNFSRKLRENYLKSIEIIKSGGERVFVINGERSPEEIFEEIKRFFDMEIQQTN